MSIATPVITAPVPLEALAPAASAPARFRLSRWFGGLSLLLVAAITGASASMMGWFVTQRMLAQEGRLTNDFVHSLILVETPLQQFLAAPGPLPAAVEASFAHIARIPDVLRANVYDRERRVIWSSDRSLIGRRFGPNEELDEALRGEVVVEKVEGASRHASKAEHEALAAREALFIEIYVPVRNVAGGEVLGAIEFYKSPRVLTALLDELRRNILLGALGFTTLLFLALFGLVRHADRIMRTQERRLVESETFAAVGEMASVVAHGIRNPLATIRSSAELMQECVPEARTEAGDIVAQCDRLGAWLREWLGYAADPPGTASPLAVAPLVRSASAEIAEVADRRNVHLIDALPETVPPVLAESLLVGQVLRSVLSNALEALRDGGQIRFDARVEAHYVVLGVQDDGPGLTPEARRRVGQPLFTSKPQGLGVGLALARRVLRRHGGRLDIGDAPGGGTRVEIILRRASTAAGAGGAA